MRHKPDDVELHEFQALMKGHFRVLATIQAMELEAQTIVGEIEQLTALVNSPMAFSSQGVARYGPSAGSAIARRRSDPTARAAAMHLQDTAGVRRQIEQLRTRLLFINCEVAALRRATIPVASVLTRLPDPQRIMVERRWGGGRRGSQTIAQVAEELDVDSSTLVRWTWKLANVIPEWVAALRAAMGPEEHFGADCPNRPADDE